MNYNDYLLGGKKGKEIKEREEAIEATVSTLSSEQAEITNSSLDSPKEGKALEVSPLSMEKNPKESSIPALSGLPKESDSLAWDIISSAVVGQAVGAARLLAGQALGSISRDIRSAIFDTKFDSDMFGSSKPVKVLLDHPNVKKDPIDKIENEKISNKPDPAKIEDNYEVKKIEGQEVVVKNNTAELPKKDPAKIEDNPEVKNEGQEVVVKNNKAESPKKDPVALEDNPEVKIEVEETVVKNNTAELPKKDSATVSVDLSLLKFANGDNPSIGVDDLAKHRPGLNSLGYISVIPQGEIDGFNIPFEFVPDIKNGSHTAQYNAHSILARIGSLQNYSHTELSTPSITTDYYVFSRDESPSSSSYGHSWMNEYTLDKVQAIQRMYESLVLPKFPKDEQTSIDNPFSYFRPPFVKIVIGGEDSTLFTYPKLQNGDLKSQNSDSNRRHKLFLVTSINIEKNLQEKPLILKDGGYIVDSFGFSVSIDLLEVTKSYMDIYPDYNTYFKSFESIVNGVAEATPESIVNRVASATSSTSVSQRRYDRNILR